MAVAVANTPAAAGTTTTTTAAPSTEQTASTPAIPATTEQRASASSAAPAGFDPAADFQGDLQVNNDIPTTADLDKVADLVVLAADGSSRRFKSLYSGEGVAARVLVIFVRHFFCGNCQEYLRSLSDSIRPDALLSLPTPTFITVIGCGRPELIPMYVEATGCPFPVYADPSRKLYDLLGMSRTLNLGPKPEYIRKSLLSGMASSIVQGLKMGTSAVKGGDIKQVGGEFMVENGEVVWCHRMRNTRDHAEIPELTRVIGFEGPGKMATKQEPPIDVTATGAAAGLTGGPTKKDKENRRRSMDLKGVIHRMSGDWGRRSDGRSSSAARKSKDVQRPEDGALAEGTRGHHNTETSHSDKATDATTPAPPTHGAATAGTEEAEPKQTPAADAVPATASSEPRIKREVDTPSPKTIPAVPAEGAPAVAVSVPAATAQTQATPTS